MKKRNIYAYASLLLIITGITCCKKDTTHPKDPNQNKYSNIIDTVISISNSGFDTTFYSYNSDNTQLQEVFKVTYQTEGETKRLSSTVTSTLDYQKDKITEFKAIFNAVTSVTKLDTLIGSLNPTSDYVNVSSVIIGGESGDKDSFVFKYDGNGNVTKQTSDEYDVVTVFEWMNGNMVSATTTSSGATSVATITYTENLNNSKIDFILIPDSEIIDSRLSTFELIKKIGNVNAYLMNTVTFTEGIFTDVYTYSYDFNEKNYPIAMEVISSITIGISTPSRDTTTYSVRYK